MIFIKEIRRFTLPQKHPSLFWLLPRICDFYTASFGCERESAHSYEKQALLVFTQLLEVKDIQIDGEAILEHALFHWEGSNADFAECLF